MQDSGTEAGLFKYPHLQLRNVSYSVRGRGGRAGAGLGAEERILDMINIEARGGELLAILATSSEYNLSSLSDHDICSASKVHFAIKNYFFPLPLPSNT